MTLVGIDDVKALQICRDNGAFYSGHFIGTQGEAKGLGLHMPEYFDSRTLVTIPAVIGRLAAGIAERLAKFKIDTVAGMPLGAYTLGHEVAKLLGVRFVMPEKSDHGIVVKRSAFVEQVTGKRVAIVEDTVNAGETLKLGIKAVKECDGSLVAIGALFDRGLVNAAELGVPYRPLITRPASEYPSYTLQDCLKFGQCSRGEPINRKPGHGHDLEELVATGRIKDNFSFTD